MLINIRRISISIVIASLVLASCSTNRPIQPDLPYRTFASISLISEKDLMEIITPATTAEKSEDGFQKGAAVGGAGGMAAAAICGPYWGLCAGGFGLIGWLGGGVTGAMYGFSGISEQDSITLKKNMEALDRKWDFQSDLVGRVKQAVPSKMLTEPDSAEIHAILVLEGVEFINQNKEVVLEAHARLVFTLNNSVSDPTIGSKVFTGRSPASDIADWRGFRSKKMKQAMEESLKLIVEEVATALTERWTP